MNKALTILAALMITGIAHAEIIFPVDVNNTRWAVFDTQSGEILHRNRVWPNLTGEPIQGLATNIVYLLHIDDTRPDVDSRIFLIESTETIDVPSNEIRKTWNTPRRPTDEIVVAAKNREVEEVERQGIDLAREVIETRLVVTAILQFAIDNQTLGPKARKFANQYKARGVRLWNNRDRLDEIIAAIEIGADVDLDQGWEPETP